MPLLAASASGGRPDVAVAHRSVGRSAVLDNARRWPVGMAPCGAPRPPWPRARHELEWGGGGSTAVCIERGEGRGSDRHASGGPWNGPWAGGPSSNFGLLGVSLCVCGGVVGRGAATRRNMRREEWVTVQGPVKKQQPDGMSQGGGGVLRLGPMRRWTRAPLKSLVPASVTDAHGTWALALLPLCAPELPLCHWVRVALGLCEMTRMGEGGDGTGR